MTDIVQEADTALSPGDVLDIPLNGDHVTAVNSYAEDIQDLDYLGTSVFDADAMAPINFM